MLKGARHSNSWPSPGFDSTVTHNFAICSIDFFNQTLAKPFRWTYDAKPLAA
jgi:hypothetical protein